MTRIELGNTHSVITDLPSKGVPKVARALAVVTPGYQFNPRYKAGHWDGLTRFFTTKTGKFPTGLLSDTLRALKANKIEYELVDVREPLDFELPEEIVLKDGDGTITLRDYQYDAVAKALDATRGVINIATNGGKTEIACGIIKCILPFIKEDQRIVFFTHTKEIFTQSHQRLEKRLGIEVGMVGAGMWNPKQVTVAMIPTIQKYTEKPKKLPKVKKHETMLNEVSDLEASYKKTKDDAERNQLKIEIKNLKKLVKDYEKEAWSNIQDSVDKTKLFLDSIVGFLGDEVHHASSDSWYRVFMSCENAYFRFGLTGTVDTKDEINAKRLFGCTGRVLSKVSNDYLIKEGHSAKPDIFLLQVNAPAMDGFQYMEARSKGIITHDIRNRVYVNKIVERANSGKQCLIIVNETEHGQIVEDMLKGNDFSVKFTHGERPDKFRQSCLEELKDGSLRVLIATSILDEGVDVSGINCIFLMAGGKSMRQVLQRIGRGLRKKSDGSGVEVYDSLDYHNEYLVEHTMERYRTYKSEGFTVSKL